MVTHVSEKIKSYLDLFRPHALLASCVFLTLLGIAGGIRLVLVFPHKTAIRIEKTVLATPEKGRREIPAFLYTASVSGTVYYPISCKSVSRIKDENKIFFSTKTEAEAAGYAPAKNCSGL